MVSEKMLALGTTRSCIRELFEYGLRQAAVVGKENVYDFSIGNPSVPAPKEVNQALIDIVTQEDSVEIHGYTPAAGYMGVREAVADDLNQRYGTKIRPQNLFFTCGAAPALVSVVRALAVDSAEFVTVAPHFVEYRPFVECNGGKLVVVPADTEHFQIPFPQLEARLTSHTQAVIINSPNNPSGVIYTQETLRKLADLLEKRPESMAIPFTSLPTNPTGSWSMTETRFPSSPRFTGTPSSVIPTPNPCPCRVSALATSVFPTRRRTAIRSLPPSPEPPGPLGMFVRPLCSSGWWPAVRVCAPISRPMTVTAPRCMRR